MVHKESYRNVLNIQWKKTGFAERSIRTSKNKIYKHMTPVTKNIYFDVLNDIVDKYNNTYHNTIKIKPIDDKPNSYA